MKQIVFDIETIPDLDFGKKFLNLEGLNDEDIGKSMFFQQQQKTGIEFLPYDLHQIIAISILTLAALLFFLFFSWSNDSHNI